MCLVGTILRHDTNRIGMVRRFSHPVSVEVYHDQRLVHFSIDLRRSHRHVVDYIVRPMDLIPK